MFACSIAARKLAAAFLVSRFCMHTVLQTHLYSKATFDWRRIRREAAPAVGGYEGEKRKKIKKYAAVRRFSVLAGRQ